ncbi:helix-turn-helix transcriptional regulator [Streptomyces profundus]|uniref:helix-turn-helix transcriptional regulator n=1 Tax=Streptomyces profundus TaxID=2867410 RepID=UPI002ADE1DEB|nr:AAA family ATPase [Streptomyces sp. MA3_2.13]
METRDVSPVFVGRKAELAELVEALRRAEAGVSQAVVVGGEAGIGKTRLLEEFLAVAGAAGATTAVGASVELGADGLPFAPLVGLLRSLHRQLGPELVEAASEPTGDLTRLLPELGEAPGHLAGGVDTVDRARMFELITRLFERLSQRRTLVLVLEDLHWSDRSTRELLAFFFRSVHPGARVMVLCSYRADDIHRRHPLRPFLAELDRLRTVQRIELTRLSGDEVAAQMAGILGTPPEATLAASVFARSDGNPFFVEELTVDPDPARGLTESLRDLLLVRVETLPEQVQDVLRVVAVGGSSVEHALLARVAGVPEPELLSALRDAVGARLLAATDDADGYRFRHALTREAVTDDLLPGERARLNRRYATALEAEPGLIAADELPTRLASYWECAGDRAKALPAVLTASVAAGRRFAYAEQLRLLERAQELWDAAPEEVRATLRPAQPMWGYPAGEVPDGAGGANGPVGWVDLQAEAVVAASLAGQYDRANAICRGALRELDEIRLPLHAAWFWVQRAGMAEREVRGDGVHELSRAQELVRGLPPSEVHARVLALTAAWHSLQGPGPEQLEQAERAVSLARLVGATSTELYARYTLASLQADAGDSAGAVVEMRSVLRTVLDRGEVSLLGRCLVNLSAVLADAGELRESLISIAEGIELADRYGLEETKSWLQANLAFVLTLQGRWDEAGSALDQARRQARSPHSEHVSRILAGQLAALRGDVDTAREAATAVRTKLSADRVRATFEVELARLEIDLALLTGEPQRSRDILRSARSDLQLGLTQLVWGLVSSAAMAEAEGRGMPGADEGRPEAVALIRELTRSLPRNLPIRVALGLLVDAQLYRAESRDRPPHWAEAVDAIEPLDLPHHLAEARYGWAESLLAAGEPDARARAAEQLRAARETTLALGAAPLRERVERLAQRARLDLSARPEPKAAPEPGDTFGLTPRERDVLGLVAAGRSNRQIAEELFISPKTASVHVSNILAKLEVTSRGEAAAVAHRLRMVPLRPT